MNIHKKNKVELVYIPSVIYLLGLFAGYNEKQG
jgi:hypothetical protein